MMGRVYNKGILFLSLVITLAALVLYANTVSAQPNLQINYQGKLTDTTGAAVTDGSYNIRFWLYDDISAATTSAIWTEEWLVGSSNGIQLTSGLFSTMLGSTTAFTGVDFNQTLYLGVEIGGTGGTPTWDGEMSPRKVLGTVPAAFEAQQLDGLATTSFLRADEADTMEATSDATLLTLIQNGTGAIFDAVNSSAESVFKVFDSATVATSSADTIATSTALALYNKDVEILLGDPVKVGGIDVADTAYAIEVLGSYAYVVSESTNDDLEIFDVSDPTDPTKVGGVAAADGANDIAVAGNYAYVVSYSTNDDLEIFDVSDPTSPTKVGGVEAGDSAFGVDVSGNYAYVVSSATGDDLEIFDVSDPVNPVKVGGVDTADAANSVRVSGSYAYVVSNSTNDDLEIFDVSDPTDPTKVGGVDTSASAVGVDISGTFVYVTSGFSGGDELEIFDISDPTSPTKVGGADVSATGRDVQISGNYAYVVSDSTDDDLEIFDISSSTNPVKIGGTDAGATAYGVTVLGNYAYVVSDTTGDDLEIFDLAGLITPTANIGNLVSNDIESDYVRVTQSLTTDGSLNVGTNALIGGALTITGTASSSLQSGNTNAALVVTSGYVGIGTTTPYADLSVAGDIALTGGIYDSAASLGANGSVLVSGATDVAWTATSSLGLGGGGGSSLFTDGGDITYLTSLTDVLSIGTTTDIATSTGLAVYNKDIEILPGAPEKVGGIDLSSNVNNVAVANDIAYTVGTGVEFQVIDVSDPTAPSVLSTHVLADQGTGIKVAGNYAYIVSRGSAFEIFDISNPTAPISVANASLGAVGNAIEVQGSYAYIGVDTGTVDEFQIFNVSDPTNPIKTASLNLSADGSVKALVANGNYVYAGTGATGGDEVMVVDVSDPTNPVKLSGVNNDSVNGGAYTNNHFFVGANSDFFESFDVSDPGNISASDSIRFDAIPSEVVIAGDYAYVISASTGGDIHVVDISDPANMVEIASTSIAGDASAVAIAGEYLYVGSSNDVDDLEIFKLPALTTPTAEIGNLLANNISTDYLRVTQALTADGSLNVGTNAMIGGTLTVVGTASSSLQGDTTQAALAVLSGGIGVGTTTDIATSTGLAVYNKDIELSQSSLTKVGSAALTDDNTALAFDIAGDLLFLANQLDNENIDIYDISDPTNPTAIASTSVGSFTTANDLEVVGNYLYAVGNGGGDDLEILDISNLSNITTVGGIEFGGGSNVSVSGNIAASPNTNLHFFDISDPSNITELAATSDGHDYEDVEIRGNFAFALNDSSNAFNIIDISDPTSPYSVGSTTVNFSANSVDVSGNYAYVVSNPGSAELQIYDISDVSNPTEVGSFDTSSGLTMSKVRVAGDYAYISNVGGTGDDLFIIDVSDPTAPVELAGLDRGEDSTVSDLMPYGGYLYVSVESTTGDDLEVYNLAAVVTPTAEIGNLLTGSIESDYLRVTQSLTTDGSLNVGTNALIGGALTITGTASSSLISGNTNAALVVTSGYVGIGTSSPYADLSIAGDMAITGGLYDNNATRGTADYILQSTGTGVQWVDSTTLGFPSSGGGSSLFTDGGDITYLTSLTDVLSIGTTTDVATSTGLAVYNRDVEILAGAPEKVGGTPTGGNSNKIEVVGDLAYVSIEASSPDFGDKFEIYDVSDPTNPTEISAEFLDGDARAMKVIGNYIYTANDSSGVDFEIHDITDPTDPIGVGGIDGTGAYLALDVVGRYAYTGTFSGGNSELLVYDVSDPTAPILIGEGDGSTTRDLKAVGNYLYVADGNLTVWDISDPSSPSQIDSLSLTESTRTLEVSGNYAYVTGDTDDLVVVDISDPNNLTEVGSTAAASQIGDLKVVGDYLFAVSNSTGDELEVFNISSSTNPFKVAGVEIGSNANGVSVQGQYVYVVTDNTSDDELHIFDLSSLVTPTAEIGNLLANEIQSDYLRVTQALNADGSLNVGTNAMVGGTLTVVGNASSSLQGDTTQAALAITSGALGIGTSTDIATSTGLALYNKDIKVSLGDPVARGFIQDGGSIDLSSSQHVVVGNGVAYVAAVGSNAVQAIDVSDPDNPTAISSIGDGENGADNLSGAFGLALQGNYLYVSTQSDGVQILDVSNATSMRGVGAVADGANNADILADARDIAVAGNYAYVTSQDDNGVQILDISDPTNPIGVGSITDGNNGADRLNGATNIRVRGSYAYVTSVFDGVQILDISDPTNPIGLDEIADNESSADTLGTPEDIEISGSYAYVAASGDDGVQILDISDPNNIVGVGSISDGNNGADTLDRVRAIDIVGDYLLVPAYNDDGVQVIDISSSTNPVGVGSISSSTSILLDGAIGIDIADGFAYIVTENDNALQILDLPSLITPTANIGNLLAGSIESNYLQVTQSLVTDGTLNVGTNALIGGALTITGTASSSLQSANTNPALVITSGYVGIGTTTPYADLSVAGDIALTGGIYDNNATRGTNGEILWSTGTGVEWVATSTIAGGSLFTDGGDISYLTSLTDVLSIGTTTDVATSTGLAVYNRDVEILAGDPQRLGSIGTDGQARDVFVRGDLAFVASNNFNDDLAIIDISDKDNPSEIGAIDLGSDNAYAVAVDGNYAYVGLDTTGFEVIDITDPTSPVSVASEGAFDVFTIAIQGSYMYLGTDISGAELKIYDISNPAAPFFVAEIDTASIIIDIEIKGSYLYNTSNSTSDDFEVIDISDPTNPIIVGGVGFTSGNSDGISINGNVAYVHGIDYIMQVIDITDPTNPTIIRAITNGSDDGVDSVVVGDYLYVGIGFATDDIYIYDISSSTNPILVGSVADYDDINRIDAKGEYLYTVTGASGDDFSIWKLPTLTTPTAQIGNLVSDDIETSFLSVTQALKADSLNVNTNGMIGGSLTITGTASSSLIASNSNTALTITSGFVEIGTSTNATSGIQIGYGGICVDNDGECTASTTGRISSVDTYSGNSDLAETYFSADDLEPGDIVELEANLSVNRANGDNTIIGVVSTKPGVLLGFDDASLEEGEQSYPIALKGRVPVKVTTENGPIEPGDQLMLSSIPGTAMKATGTGAVVGIALEAFDPAENDQYFSDTFINQFTDDLPSTEDVEEVITTLQASSTETLELDNNTDVQKGQIVMFVDLSYRYIDEHTNEQLTTLMNPADEDDDASLFDRITNLAKSFVDGVLSLTRLNVDRAKVEVVCIDDGTCLNGAQLQALLERATGSSVSITDVVTNTSASDENQSGDSIDTQDPVNAVDQGDTAASTTTETSATTTESGENTTPTTTDISDNIDTASTTTAGGDLGNEETASSTDNTAIEPQNTDTDVQRENVEETTVEDEEPASVETPVSTEQETDETPEEDTPPEPEVVEEEVVETPPESTSEDVNQETS